ncbi:MAG: response regulator [Anaerolineae bacterium]|nr:response regulator [Anaerolineae bacterium]MCA9888542.1 response regulator [Anaerolineae bacterium]MCA9893555.1 response regulator [Anaerolineae bacterium]MCB9458171.1 response regulator [Anaerolineaceae bacterium]
MVDQPLALIIEDESGLAVMYERVLQSMGYQVMTASDGETGLACLQSYTPHFILSDMRLPIINGKDLIAYIASEPRFDQTFVLVASSGQEYETFITPLKRARFIVKPLLPTQLIEVAQGLIST